MTALTFDRMPADGPITGSFGEAAPPWSADHPHRGLDIGCPEGTPVVAPAVGRLVAFFNDGSFGRAICLDHEGTPWFSLYAHLSRVDALIGELVERGHQLGLSGSSGTVSGPHLHWQVCDRKDFPRDIGRSADPLGFFLGDPGAAPLEPTGGEGTVEAALAAVNRATLARFRLLAEAGEELVEAVVVFASALDAAANRDVVPD